MKQLDQLECYPLTALASYAGVPRVAAVRAGAPAALAERSQIVRYGQVVDVFDALVSQLPWHTQAQWAAERYRKFPPVHAMRNQRLRVQGLGHVDALPNVGLNRAVDNVAPLWQRSDAVQYVGKRHACPFGNVSPSLFAANHGDVRTCRESFDLRDRERSRTGHHPVHHQTPIHKTRCLQPLKLRAQGIDFVGEWLLGNLAALKFPRHGMAIQYPLSRIGQRLAGPVNSAPIRRDQPMLDEVRSAEKRVRELLDTLKLDPTSEKLYVDELKSATDEYARAIRELK